MPNWKKIALSGSSPEFSSLDVDNSISAGSITGSLLSTNGVISSSGDLVSGELVYGTGGSSVSSSNLVYLDTANERVGIKTTSPQYPFHYVQDTGNALAVYEKTGGAAIFYEAQDTRGALGTVASHPLLFAINSAEVSRINTSGVYEGDISGSLVGTATGSFSGSFIGDGSGLTGITADGTLSSSAQIATDISGSLSATAIAALGAGLISGSVFSGSFSGSFQGDGSSLTGIDVGEVTLKTDNFTSVTSKQVTHTFGTKDVNVTVYDSNDKLIIPASVTTTDTNTVDITFDTATTGRVVITKGGHIVTGSIQIASSSTVSDTFTAQTSYTASHTFGTTDVFVQVYDNTDSLIIPQKIKILTTGSIGLDFDTATTGKVIIGKSGHIVSGSAEVSTVSYDNVTSKPTLISSSAQIASDISGSFTATSASIASDIANISTDFGSITNNPFTASGTQITASGHIIPSANDTYDLGSTTKQWRDLFLSSGSLYIDGTKIVSSDATTLTFTTDTGQSIKLLETGADDIILQTDTGNIELKGTVEILTGKKITDSAGTKILFGDSIGITGSIDLTGTVDGIDLQAFSSSVATGLASSTADYTQLTNVPSGIISSSTQIASDISGSFTSTSSSLASRLSTAESELSNTLISSSAQIASDISGSLSATAIAALGSGIVSGSSQIDLGSATGTAANATSASFASTGPFLSNTGGTVDGDLTLTGTLTAQTYIVSSSVTYMTQSFSSGSTIFGDSLDDTHLFTGSLNVTGSLLVSGNAQFIDSIQINDNNTILSQKDSNGQLKINTQYGYLEIGPNNSTFSHFYTDISKFYFNKQIVVDSGLIGAYDENLQLTAPYNTTRLTINKDTGNVGIGTTSPSALTHIHGGTSDYAPSSTGSGLFHITAGSSSLYTAYVGITDDGVSFGHNGSDRYLRFDTNETERMRINSSGNVGIGTTSPTSKLHLNVEDAAGSLTLSRGGTNLSTNTDIANLNFYADYNGTPTQYGGITVHSNDISNVRGSIDFDVKSTSGTLVNGMTIYGTNTGVNVGIGTTSPDTKLHITDTSSAFQFTADTGTAGDGRLNIGHFSNGTFIGTYGDDGGAADIIRFGNHSGDERMRIDTSGNVGIGNTSPSTALEVSGTVTATAFAGDGSALTGNSYTETFTSQTAVTASHSLGTKNVTVSVYGSDDYMLFPTSIKTHDDNNVYVQFNSSRSGRIVITK